MRSFGRVRIFLTLAIIMADYVRSDRKKKYTSEIFLRFIELPIRPTTSFDKTAVTDFFLSCLLNVTAWINLLEHYVKVKIRPMLICVRERVNSCTWP